MLVIFCFDIVSFAFHLVLDVKQCIMQIVILPWFLNKFLLLQSGKSAAIHACAMENGFKILEVSTYSNFIVESVYQQLNSTSNNYPER